MAEPITRTEFHHGFLGSKSTAVAGSVWLVEVGVWRTSSPISVFSVDIMAMVVMMKPSSPHKTRRRERRASCVSSLRSEHSGEMILFLRPVRSGII
jgi:hypothetical protein